MQFFFWLGQGPSPDAPLRTSANSKILQRIPNTFFIVAHVSLFISGAILQNVFTETYGKHYLITNFYLIIELTANIIVYAQFIANKSVLNKTIHAFNEVNQMIRLNFGCQPEFDRSIGRTRMKMFCILFTFAVDISLYLLPPAMLGDKLELSVHLEVLQSATAIGCMHAVLYINLLSFYMKTLNKVLVRKSKSSGIYHTAEHDQVLLLNKIKMIHFHFWNIAQDINRFFGCGLGAILLRNFVDSTFGIYWAFLLMDNHDPFSLIQLIRTCNGIHAWEVSEMTTYKINIQKQVRCADSQARRSRQF